MSRLIFIFCMLASVFWLWMFEWSGIFFSGWIIGVATSIWATSWRDDLVRRQDEKE